MLLVRRYLLGFVCIFLLVATASAALPGPMEQIRATVDGVLSILKETDLAKPVRRERLSAAILARFDFDEMSQRILALNWKSATSDQRDAFVKAFSSLLERNYIGHIEAYTDEKVAFVKERIQGNRAAVDSVIQTKSVEIPISYRLVQAGDEWKVYDVVIESVSFVNNYRSSYGEIVKKEGFDGLLRRMAEKLAELELNNGSATQP